MLKLPIVEEEYVISYRGESHWLFGLLQPIFLWNLWPALFVFWLSMVCIESSSLGFVEMLQSPGNPGDGHPEAHTALCYIPTFLTGVGVTLSH